MFTFICQLFIEHVVTKHDIYYYGLRNFRDRYGPNGSFPPRFAPFAFAQIDLDADSLNGEERRVITEAVLCQDNDDASRFRHAPTAHILLAYSSTSLEKETSSHVSGETVVSASANSHIQHSMQRNRETVTSASCRGEGIALTFYSPIHKIIRKASTIF